MLKHPKHPLNPPLQVVFATIPINNTCPKQVSIAMKYHNHRPRHRKDETHRQPHIKVHAVKPVLTGPSERSPKICFQDSLNAGRKYCRMLTQKEDQNCFLRLIIAVHKSKYCKITCRGSFVICNVTYICRSPDLLWIFFGKRSKWLWSGNTTITYRRQPCGTARKSHSTITRHQEDKPSKATSPLFPIKMIAILEWTQSNVQQNIEQLQTPTMGATINKKSTTTEQPP